MAINTKMVQGRRALRFTALDEIVADADKLVSSPHTKVLGNWPLSQLLTHLATSINSSIDGISARAPWYIRPIGLFMKGRILKRGMSPGFNLPKEVENSFFPASASSRDALDKLRTAIGRTGTEKMTARHPILGRLSHEDWTRLHLRHAELHLSFALPG